MLTCMDVSLHPLMMTGQTFEFSSGIKMDFQPRVATELLHLESGRLNPEKLQLIQAVLPMW